MSGKELKEIIDSHGYVHAEIARLLGMSEQSFDQKFKSQEIKTGLLEDLCRVLDKDMSFFYGGTSSQNNDELEKQKNTIKHLYEAVQQLQEENSKLKVEIIHLNDPDKPRKESEVYRLWMEYMKITERMQELYQKQKEE